MPSWRRLTRFLPALLFVSGAAALGQSRPATTQSADGPVRLDVRISPIVNLHYAARTAAADPAASPATWLADASAAAREFDAELGSPLMWGLVEGRLAGCESAADVLRAFERLPETRESRERGGKSIRLREPAVKLAKALVAAEKQFIDGPWPAQRATLERAQRRLREEIASHGGACYDFLRSSLEMSRAAVEIPIYLVAQSPPPHAITHRTLGGGVCFVGVQDADSSLFMEETLHETIHALDLVNSSSSLQTLRKMLSDAGLKPADRAYRDIPHTLMFVQAAETVRRCVDQAHRDYGDALGYYLKVPEAAAAVRPAWGDFLAGRTTRAQALSRIVDAARAMRKKDE